MILLDDIGFGQAGVSGGPVPTPNMDALAGRVSMEREGALADEVIEALLNHETSFFRDLAQFKSLTDEVLPALGGNARKLRAWSAGCSTGQEAYSLAMAAPAELDILGSDISAAAIGQARDGLYSQFEAQRGMPITRLIAHFEMNHEAWRAKPALRTRVQWAVHNLLDPAPGRFDLILCRNVLLYFSPEKRALVFDRLAEAIAPNGVLMLGAGETVLGQTEAFVPHPVLKGFYGRRPDA